MLHSENDLEDDLYDYVPGTGGGGHGDDEIYEDLMSATHRKHRRSRAQSVKCYACLQIKNKLFWQVPSMSSSQIQ